MKKLIILLSITLCATFVSAQVDTTQFTGYTVCMTCGETWNNSTSQKVNQYATGQSKSQQNTLQQNALASQTVNSSKRFVRGIVATVVGVFVAAVTMSIITKTNQSANALFH